MGNYLESLRELAQLSERVQAATQAQAWDDLLAALELRQGVIDRVDALGPDVPLTSDEAAEATRLLEEIARIDAACSDILDTALASTRAVLQDGTQTRASISAYRRMAQSGARVIEARFVDKNR